MSFSSEFGRGIKAYGEAHQVLFRYRLTKYLILPGIITICYSVVFFLVALHFAGRISGEADSYPWWLGWMGAFTEWLMKSVYWLVMGFVFFVTLKYVVQVILAPVLSNLSVAVEKKVLGQTPPSLTWKESLQDIQRSLAISIRNSLHELGTCLLLNFIPGFGQLASIGVSSYFYGFGYMDYVMERKRMTIPQSVAFCRQHRGLAVGLGVVMYLMMLVPFIGWMIAPTYATVAATLETLRLLNAREEQPAADIFVSSSSGRINVQ